MKIDCSIDSASLNKLIDNWEKKLAFAVSDGINEIAKSIQKVERENINQHFTVRQNEFINRNAAIIKPFASPKKGIMFAEIAVGQRKGLLLSTFEAGGTKSSLKGSRVAVPITGTASRPGFSSSVNPKFTFKAMSLKKTKTKSGKTQYKGNNRTFILPSKGVFQRTGSQRSDIEILYKFKANPHLQASLRFVATAQRVSDEWLNRNIKAQLRRKDLLGES